MSVPPRREFLRRNPFPYPQTLGLFYREKMAAIHALLPAGRPARILEVGGGRSGLTRLCFPSSEIISIDLDLEELRGLQPHEPRIQADATRLPFADGSFDCVTMFDVIEHIEDDELAGREAQRVLSPGGVLLVSTPTDRFRYPYFPALCRVLPTQQQILADWGHVRIGYRPEDLHRLFGALAVEEVRHFQGKLSVLSHDISFARWRIGWRRLCIAALWPLTRAGMALQSRHRGIMVAVRYRKRVG